MSKENYELLKAEIPVMAELVKSFPEALQEQVFHLLSNTLLDRPNGNNHSEAKEPEIEEVIKQPVPLPQNYVEGFKKYLNEKGPASTLNASELTAVIAHFFIYLAPENKKVSEINDEILIEGFKLAAQKPPIAPRSTFWNAKSAGYMQQGSKKGYHKLTDLGEHFVVNELPHPRK